jgi:RluA family pseudouridine synthase
LVAPKNAQDLGDDSLDPESIPLVFRGADYLVVDKPAGVPAHPGRGQVRRTLAVALAQRFGGEAETGGPWLCHRLDRETSGLVLVALSRAALTRFMMDFEARRIRRFYTARVVGAVPWRLGGAGGWDDAAATQVLDAPLRVQTEAPYRVLVDPAGLACVTRVQVAGVGPETSDLWVEPITGRQHQIRVHLAHAGFPLVGDPFYGTGPVERMHLHAHGLLLVDGTRIDAPRWATLAEPAGGGAD